MKQSEDRTVACHHSLMEQSENRAIAFHLLLMEAGVFFLYHSASFEELLDLSKSLNPSICLPDVIKLYVFSNPKLPKQSDLGDLSSILLFLNFFSKLSL